MSLLLDALNKADQERKRNESNPSIHSNHGYAGDHHSRRFSIAVIAAVVIGLVILLAVIYWLGQRSTIAAPTTTAISPTPSTTIISASSNASQTIGSTESTGATKSIAATQTSANAIEEIPVSEQDVANLYAQNTQLPDPVTQAPVTQTPLIQTPATETMAISPNNDESAEPALSTPTSINQFANLPDLHDLPNQILQNIPSLNYSEHNYNMAGGSVKINGEIKHVNDQLAAGLVIDKILEDGMILHLDNYSFKMRALNSWVNM
jgi:general secretion pathway protein B